jgi:DNA-binding transcriptional LysR family regulator
MNLKQLNAFREVMRTGSVSEAARNLYRTQPAISALISSLEENLGYQLFSRHGGRLHPVPEAHYLYEEAGEVLDRLDAVEQTLKSVRDLERGVIRIVAMPGPSAFLLPDLIAKFVTGREDVKVTLITRNSLQVQQLVSVQQYDLGLGDLGVLGSVKSPLVDYDTFRLSCLCAMAADDPLAAKEVITAEDLDGKPMATLFADHPSFTQTKAAFDEMRVTFKQRFETQYFIPLLTFVERGLAYAVVDPWSAESYKIYHGGEPRVVFRPFLPRVMFSAAIMTPAHKPLSKIASTFAEEFRKEILRISELH